VLWLVRHDARDLQAPSLYHAISSFSPSLSSLMLLTQRSSEPLLDMNDHLLNTSDMDDSSQLGDLHLGDLGQVHQSPTWTSFRTLGRTFSRRSSNYSTLSSDTKRELYSDRFVSLTTTHLTIKSYYFPIPTACAIPIGRIALIRPGTVIPMSATKAWGLASNVWWSKDMHRGKRMGKELIVVCCEGEWIGKGATVERDDDFWRVWNDLRNEEKL
jgi:hypothetical protein